ncbi:MAG: class I SAM-dependent methyltransferase [Proteobacteria bacterium]|nr:class I SAM-dependent methyltransferase [Pseudomonadota bacterium]
MNFFCGVKKPEYYKGLLMKADMGLHAQIADTIARVVPAGGKILDFGAGEGALSLRLIDIGYQVVSVDKEEFDFQCNGAKFTRVDFDSPEELNSFLTSHAGEFDAVLGIEVIEHVQDQWKYVRGLMAMVKQGGTVLITTPNISSWLSRFMFFFTGRFHGFGDSSLSYGHIHPISPWELNLILKTLGAENIQIGPAGTLPAIYLTNNRLTLFNLMVLPFRPFMRGILDGWCVMAVAQKPFLDV